MSTEIGRSAASKSNRVGRPTWIRGAPLSRCELAIVNTPTERQLLVKKAGTEDHTGIQGYLSRVLEGHDHLLHEDYASRYCELLGIWNTKYESVR